VRELGRRLILWRVGTRWYAVALLLPAAQTLTTFGLFLLFGGERQSQSSAPSLAIGPEGTPIWLRIAALMAMFSLGFDGLGEELGWRGFALPRLLRRFSPLMASVIMGAVWAVWHVPMALTAGSPMSGIPFHHHLSHMFAVSILFTWIFQNTRGSILLAILFHAANNVTFNVLPHFLPGAYATGVWAEVVRWATVLAVVKLAGPRHLARLQPAETTISRAD
jgi:membrane protease YdiL (CAAX protease family)